ncbi:MAG: CDP-alcohol phosphatidyltransferase family protein [Propionivibrio sp.]
MFDQRVLEASRGLLGALAGRLVALGIKADQVSWFGFAVGLGAVPFIAMQHAGWALPFIFLNRVLDGVDGALARRVGATDRGAFLDISLDFLFYSAIPLAFAIADPAANALAAALLIYAFVGTGSTFLAFAVIAAKRGLASTAYPGKGFYYLGGLTEATETIAVFAAMCLFPAWFVPLACVFAALCGMTTIARIVAGLRAFK